MDDLDSAEIMFKAGKYNMVCFFSHQAVEKALKAFLISYCHTRHNSFRDARY
ncbi:HEPN domain-containing protein [Caldanaerobacter subterraneus]|uniref:HEPN domain-containing protein n=1 Tax=Caldanaerobacter subterraneus TaxID=911092 RepID=A0A7Y2PMB5_9THEO|nr:HEPN domain-containing protein [Caldanaerobacter subterraneus]